MNIILKHVHSVVQKISLKSIPAVRNNYVMIIELTTHDIIMNSVLQTDMKINMKSSASFTAKIMKFIIKSAVKSVMNMNTHINLSENTQTAFMKKIHIVLSVTFQITSSNELENKSF